MTANGAPTRDLMQIIFVATPGIISAIPLKPATWIVRRDPTFAPPFPERLRCDHTEMVQRGSCSTRRKLRSYEPARWKLVAAIGHIFSAEHAKFEHLFRRQVRREPWMKRSPNRFCAKINVPLLHFVIHLDTYRLHSFLLRENCVSFHNLAQRYKSRSTAENAEDTELFFSVLSLRPLR